MNLFFTQNFFGNKEETFRFSATYLIYCEHAWSFSYELANENEK